MRRIVLALACTTAVLTLAACGADKGSGGAAPSTAGGGPATTAVPVQKDVLAVAVDPPGAPGRTLTNIRYTIAPGAKLSPHIHPGIQLATIQSGALTYTIISGTADVTRANGTKEKLTGPANTTLNAGDSVAEPDGMVHFGANETTQPVVIIASLLTEDGKDLAVTVSTAAASGTTR